MLSVTTSLLASAHGFALQGSVGANEMMCAATQQPRSLAPPLMSSEPLFSAETSRRAVLAALLGAGVGAGAMPATAGYVTSLGLETTKPTDADVDDELLASRAIQGSLNSLKKYKATAASLKGAFFKDTTMQLIPTIRKEFDFSKLRDDLNVVTTVFDDTTQLTVDRLSRSILYDLTELENASRLKKEETSRTEKKIAAVAKWFDKLDGDFATFLAYFPAVKARYLAPPPPPPPPPAEEGAAEGAAPAPAAPAPAVEAS